jgi:hypothetical protein
MNLFEELDLDKDSSYEQFVIKANQAYSHEVDMYGDIMKAGDRRTNIWVLDFGVPIPHLQLWNKDFMYDMRDTFRFNPDIPGAIENVHPNKFIANLRPVDEFRHTPVIPISEKELSAHNKKIEEANRRGYYFEIKKDTLYYWAIAILMLTVIIYIFMVTN